MHVDRLQNCLAQEPPWCALSSWSAEPPNIDKHRLLPCRHGCRTLRGQRRSTAGGWPSGGCSGVLPSSCAPPACSASRPPFACSTGQPWCALWQTAVHNTACKLCHFTMLHVASSLCMQLTLLITPFLSLCRPTGMRYAVPDGSWLQGAELVDCHCCACSVRPRHVCFTGKR